MVFKIPASGEAGAWIKGKVGGRSNYRRRFRRSKFAGLNCQVFGGWDPKRRVDLPLNHCILDGSYYDTWQSLLWFAPQNINAERAVLKRMTGYVNVLYKDKTTDYAGSSFAVNYMWVKVQANPEDMPFESWDAMGTAQGWNSIVPGINPYAIDTKQNARIVKQGEVIRLDGRPFGPELQPSYEGGSVFVDQLGQLGRIPVPKYPNLILDAPDQILGLFVYVRCLNGGGILDPRDAPTGTDYKVTFTFDWQRVKAWWKRLT